MTTIAHRLETRTGLADRAPLAGLLGLAAVLYLWGLTRNGYANEFYAAAAKAGTQSWKAFLFGSLDASNYITVDKPPASLWLMELSGRIFGFSSFSLLLPQALAGVASVGLLYATVRRWFGRTAALLSGLILALTPVAALMFRFDNPDALLVLLLVAAAFAVTRALEKAGTWWLALAGALVGLAFLTKMLQAFLVLPAFALVYLVAAPTSLRRRVGQILLAGLALVVALASPPWWRDALSLGEPAIVAPSPLVEATDRLAADAPRRLFHYIAWGPYLAWRLDDGGHIFVDGRFEAYRPEVFADYEAISRGAPGWDARLAGYDVDHLVLSRAEQPALVQAVASAPSWQETFAAGDVVVYRRRGPS